MIKTHTAQSLGKYIGNTCLINNSQRGILTGLNSVDHIFHQFVDEAYLYVISSNSEPDVFNCRTMFVYPILKPYEKLLEPMIHEGKEIIPIECIYNAYMPCKITHNTIIDHYNTYACNMDFSSPNLEPETGIGGYTPDIIENLIQRGFGAIEDNSSPTGYRDLFGYVCEVEK